jgi:hypothetical protein
MSTLVLAHSVSTFKEEVKPARKNTSGGSSGDIPLPRLPVGPARRHPLMMNSVSSRERAPVVRDMADLSENVSIKP